MRQKGKLKLFVWHDFSSDYTPGLAFAIAEDEIAAKALVEQARGFEVYEWGDLEILPLNKAYAACVSGGS